MDRGLRGVTHLASYGCDGSACGRGCARGCRAGTNTGSSLTPVPVCLEQLGAWGCSWSSVSSVWLWTRADRPGGAAKGRSSDCPKPWGTGFHGQHLPGSRGPCGFGTHTGALKPMAGVDPPGSSGQQRAAGGWPSVHERQSSAGKWPFYPRPTRRARQNGAASWRRPSAQPRVLSGTRGLGSGSRTPPAPFAHGHTVRCLRQAHNSTGVGLRLAPGPWV